MRLKSMHLLACSYGLLFIMSASAVEEVYDVIENDHPHRESIMSAASQRIKRASPKRVKIVESALKEIKEPLEGREARERYHANRFEWWCSEFSRYVLYQSEYYGEDKKKGERILAVALSSKLIKFFETEERGYFFKDKNEGVKIEAGDYLAYTESGTKPNHSSIVIYVDYKKNFVLTAEGNASLNDRVALIKRPIHIENKINPEFYFLGKIKD